jgi:hypothetical protein
MQDTETLVHLRNPEAGPNDPWHSAMCGSRGGYITLAKYAITCKDCTKALKSRLAKLSSKE